MAQLLEGMRVLDLGRNVAAPYAAKLLADYGADVIKVEHPAGDPARRVGPFFHDEPHPETSALFLHLNTNKRGITLDLSTREGQRILRRLAADADTIVEDFAPGQMEAWGIGYDALAADHPELVLASITPFGQSGPYRDYRGSEITLQALGGSLHSNGSAGRYPVKLGGHAAHYYAGTAAALGMMLACYRVDAGDRGDWIDLAVYETQAGSMDRRRYFLTVAAYTGYPARRPSPGTHVISGVRPTRDGYVNVAGMHRPEALLRLIGREDLLGPEGLQGSAFPESDAFLQEVETSFLAWLLQRGKREVVETMQSRRILAGLLQTTEDLLEDEHYRSRGVWETVDHPATGPIEYPGRQLVLSETPKAPAARAPLLSEHTAEVLVDELGADLGLTRADLSRLRAEGVI